jgi:hypothetical protein
MAASNFMHLLPTLLFLGVGISGPMSHDGQARALEQKTSSSSSSDFNNAHSTLTKVTRWQASWVKVLAKHFERFEDMKPKHGARHLCPFTTLRCSVYLEDHPSGRVTNEGGRQCSVHPAGVSMPRPAPRRAGQAQDRQHRAAGYGQHQATQRMETSHQNKENLTRFIPNGCSAKIAHY